MQFHGKIVSKFNLPISNSSRMLMEIFMYVHNIQIILAFVSWKKIKEEKCLLLSY